MIAEDEDTQIPLPPNVVTNNGEVVKFEGEPITYESAPLNGVAARLTVTAHPIGDETRRSLRGKDWNQEGQAEDWNQPIRAEDWNNTPLRRTDNPPIGDAAVLDDTDVRPPNEPPGAVGTDAVNQQGTNGPAFSGTEFVGDAFAVDGRKGDPSTTNFANSNFGNFTFAVADQQGGGNSPDPDRDASANNANGDRIDAVEDHRQHVLARLDHLDALIQDGFRRQANRGHNNPPEMLDIEQSAMEVQLQEAVVAIKQLRLEASRRTPDAAIVEAQASSFKRIAAILAGAVAVTTAFVVKEVASLEIALAHAHYRQAVIEALYSAADVALSWAHALSSTL